MAAKKAKKDKSHFEPFITEGAFKGSKRCQAFRSNGIDQCGRPATTGFNVCNTHGAKGGSGFKGGRSRWLPSNLAEKFEEILDDEELVKNRDNIRLQEAMIRETLERLQTENYPAELWKTAIEHYRKAIKGGPEGLASLKALGKILENGLGNQRDHERLLNLMEQQRKQRDSENRRVAMNEANLNLREANALVTALRAAIEAEVPDAEQRKRIAIRLVRILSTQTG